MIVYNGIEYKTRNLAVMLEGERIDITIAGIELSMALMNEDDMLHDKQAESIDESIYFYVDDINQPAEEICADGLDTPMELIEEL